MGVCYSKQNQSKEPGQNPQDVYKIIQRIQNNTYLVSKWSFTKESFEIAHQKDQQQPQLKSEKQIFVMKSFVNLQVSNLTAIKEDVAIHKKIELENDFYFNKIAEVFWMRDAASVIYEYWPAFTKEELRSNLNDGSRRRILSQVVQAFVFLEKLTSVYHGNISLNNILIHKETYQVKITDLAMNRCQQIDQLNANNLIFRAPEWDQEITYPVLVEDYKKADSWSMGVALGLLSLMNIEDCEQQFLDLLAQKKRKEAQDLLLNKGDEFGVLFFMLLEIDPTKRINILPAHSLLCKLNLKAEIIEIHKVEELENVERMKRKSQVESISKLQIELQALQIGSILGEKLLAFMPQMKLEDVTSAFFKMQRNNLGNKALPNISRAFQETQFNSLQAIEINLGINYLTGEEAAYQLKEMIESINTPLLTSFKLYLSINQLGDLGASIVFAAMLNMPQIYLSKLELSLGQNEISDNGAKLLGQLLQKMDLQRISGLWIYLGMNDLTSEEKIELSQRFKFNSSVRIVY